MSPDRTSMPWDIPGAERNEQLTQNVSGVGRSLREMVLSVRGTVQVIEDHSVVTWSPDADDPVYDRAEYEVVEEEEDGDVGDDPRENDADIPNLCELPSPTGIVSLLESLPRVTSKQFEIPAHLEAEETDNKEKSFAADEKHLAATDDLLEQPGVSHVLDEP